MKTLPSSEVQKNFDSVADMVCAGENIRVTKYGRPAFFIIPETSDTEELLRRIAGRRLSKLLGSSTPTQAANALSQADVNKLIEECFA